MDRLKKELQKLRRENSRLKKQLSRFDEEFQDEADAPEPSDKKNKKQPPGDLVEARAPSCEKCAKETRLVEFGQYKYQCCDYCNHRQKLK